MTEVAMIPAGHAEHPQEIRSKKPEGRGEGEGHSEDEHERGCVEDDEGDHRVQVIALALECHYCHQSATLSNENAGWEVPGCGPPAVKQPEILPRITFRTFLRSRQCVRSCARSPIWLADAPQA